MFLIGTQTWRFLGSTPRLASAASHGYLGTCRQFIPGTRIAFQWRLEGLPPTHMVIVPAVPARKGRQGTHNGPRSCHCQVQHHLTLLTRLLRPCAGFLATRRPRLLHVAAPSRVGSLYTPDSLPDLAGRSTISMHGRFHLVSSWSHNTAQ